VEGHLVVEQLASHGLQLVTGHQVALDHVDVVLQFVSNRMDQHVLFVGFLVENGVHTFTLAGFLLVLQHFQVEEFGKHHSQFVRFFLLDVF